MTIGEALKSLRLHAGMTQTEMAAGIVTESFYSKVERDLTAMAGIVRAKTGISCTSIKQLVPKNVIENLISAIKSKLLKVLIKLDKEYGCLDELDIDITEKDPEEVRKINATIINYIFEDRSIKIGDKNRIDGTEIRGGENHG